MNDTLNLFAFFQLVIIGSFFIWGIYKVLMPGNILSWIGKPLYRWKEKTVPLEDYNRTRSGEKIFLVEFKAWISKPLGTCIVCMSSIYGSIFYWTFHLSGFYISPDPVILYICFLFTVTGFNYFLLCLVD